MIRRNVELEARLIDDLLDLTRIDRGKVQLNFEVVDAHTLLQNALEICQAEIDRKHLTHSLNLGAQKVHMRADPARLQQIFWNLINNAVKFTQRNGRIIISTSNDSSGQLRVEIADTGLGIEPEALPKIFDAFEQGGRTQLGGLGLGLAISKNRGSREQLATKAPVEIKARRSPGFPDERQGDSNRSGRVTCLPERHRCGSCLLKIRRHKPSLTNLFSAAATMRLANFNLPSI
jgi:signal transduction histidine kinase